MLKNIFIISILVISTNIYATNGDIRIGLNAVEAGMANAIIAKPEDAGTIFSNPAGLSVLEFENIRLDLGFALIKPPRSVNGNQSDSNLFFLPSGAVAFNINKKLTAGLGFAALAGFGVDIDDAFTPPNGNQPIVTARELFKFAPAVAAQLNENLSIGGSFDIYNQSLALNGFNGQARGQFSLPQNRQFGFGATIGTIYKLSNKIQLGASYATKGNISEHEFNVPTGKVTIDLDYPSIITAGIAYEPQPGLVIEADIKRIGFADVRDRVVVGGATGTIPAILPFGWSDQTVYAVGVRKKMNDKMTLRAGFNYGKSPIESADVNGNLGGPAIAEKHLTLGLTRHINKNMAMNVAYTKAFENELRSPTAPNGSFNTIKLNQQTLNVNLTLSY